MTKRRIIGILILLLGIGCLLIPISIGKNFEELYQRWVEINYHSIKDARDILYISIDNIDLVPKKGYLPPPGLRETFLKNPSILEVAEEISIRMHIDGWRSGAPEEYEVHCAATTPDILRVANIELVGGRFLTWEDLDKKNAVCVMESMGEDWFRKAFGREVKIGDHIFYPYYEKGELFRIPLEIVGFVRTHTVYDYQPRELDNCFAFLPLSIALKIITEEVQRWGLTLDDAPKLSITYHFRVLSNLKAAREIYKTEENYLNTKPYYWPSQKLTPIPPEKYPFPPNPKYLGRSPPWVSEPRTLPYVPFTNYPLLLLRGARWLYYNLFFLAFILIGASIILFWKK